MDLSREFSLQNIPPAFNFAYDIVDRYAAEEPQKLALVWCNDNEQEIRFTFADISRRSLQVANFLQAHGIQKGDKVMLILRRRYEYWFFILALHRIGAIAVPVAEQLLHKDFEYRINLCGAKMLVASENEKLLQEIEKCRSQIPSVKTFVTVAQNRSEWVSFNQEIEKYSTDFIPPTTNNLDPMIMYFTSGTSGLPKLVVHNYLYPLAHIVTAKYWLQVVDGGLHYTMAELGWGKASWGKIYGQWICGSAVFVYDRKSFSPEKILQKIEKYKITTFCAPPTIYRYLAKLNFSKYDLSSLKNICSAGEPLPVEIAKSVYEKTGLEVREGYGQTETTLLAANFCDSQVRMGSIGKPSWCYNSKIITDSGSECAANECGEFVIDVHDYPIGLFTGYYENGKVCALKTLDGFYHTGDIVRRDCDGYIWFIGRKDDIIKSAGFRISPFEVESVLLQNEAVEECRVAGVADSLRGQVVKAFVVLANGFTASAELKEKLISFVKSQTALYKAPRIIEFVDELPKTVNGKISRKEN